MRNWKDAVDLMNPEQADAARVASIVASLHPEYERVRDFYAMMIDYLYGVEWDDLEPRQQNLIRKTTLEMSKVDILQKYQRRGVKGQPWVIEPGSKYREFEEWLNSHTEFGTSTPRLKAIAGMRAGNLLLAEMEKMGTLGLVVSTEDHVPASTLTTLIASADLDLLIVKRKKRKNVMSYTDFVKQSEMTF